MEPLMPCDEGHQSRRWATRLYTYRHSNSASALAVSVIGHACLAWNGHHPRSTRLGAPRGERQSPQTLLPCRDLTFGPSTGGRQEIRRLRPQTWAVRWIRPGVACRVRQLTLCRGLRLCRSGRPHISRPSDRAEMPGERAILTENRVSRSGVSASLPPSTHHHTTTFEQLRT